jgi:phytoene dehydrogenase-like protein
MGNSDSYDAIIIGAGIGGLVCGCYLAKAGMKVLICEQHYKPGGYCTSFKRGPFTFDAAAHCFGGYREDGITRKVFRDLEMDKKIKIIKSDPSDIVITPEHKITYWANLDRTIEEFRTAFPKEGDKIKKFLNFLLNPDPNTFSRLRGWTFNNLMDHYFTNNKLKTVLAAPLLGLGGLPPSSMSAFIASKLFSEFLLDGGYHPKGGMQTLSDALAERFRELGGELRCSSLVQKIKVKDNKVIGIVLAEGSFIPSKYVISNCDARQTFLKLLNKENLGKEFIFKIRSMIPSISNFILYLGLDSYFDSLPTPGTTYCYFSHYDLDKAYQASQRGNIEDYGGYMFYIYKDIPAILAIIPAPYKNKLYWQKNKSKFLESFINRIEKYSIPNLSQHIVFKEAATPYTLHRYTLNYRGASFGWAGTPSQLALTDFKKPSFIKGLYLTGHWTTQGLGISGVAYVGSDIAKMILRGKTYCE